MSLDAPSSSALHAREAKPRAPQVADWRPLTAALAIAGAVALSLALQAALIALDDAPAVVAGSAVVLDVVLIAVVLVVAARGAQRLGGATLGLRRTAFWPALGWVVALLLGIFLAEAVLALIVRGAGLQPHSGHHAAHAVAPGIAVLLALGLAISAPIAEELAFRGYLFPALAGWRGPWTGALLTAVLFASAHVLVLPLVALPGIAVFGFGACLLRWFTGSLLPGIALHSLNNAIVLTALTRGQLWFVIPAAPLLCLALLAPFSRQRAEEIEDAVAA